MENNRIMDDEERRWRLFLVSQEPRRCGDLEIYKPVYLIGRDRDVVDGVIASNPMISRKHCRIEWMESNYFITDLNSRNGTKLNGESMVPDKPYIVANGDIISIAGTKYAALLKYGWKA